uniref:Uncharacterized protein n=1 Tax=Nelumbo nucifera TaxID=4432 RepID=A0A822XTW3_NELNU|nr:TPA_asm: hypothetical protein HUJ06_024905 [Nelumbo nucifera]
MKRNKLAEKRAETTKTHWHLLVFSFHLLVSDLTLAESSNREALLALKSAVDPSNSLPWEGYNFYNWQGIRECLRGRVTKMSLFLNDNKFSGNFPSSISDLHRLKVVVLSGNKISSNIPSSLLKLQQLYVLYLQDNRLTGELPPLNQTSLRFFNFNFSSFSSNLDLCGDQIDRPCSNGTQTQSLPSISPTSQINISSSSLSNRPWWARLTAMQLALYEGNRAPSCCGYHYQTLVGWASQPAMGWAKLTHIICPTLPRPR